MLAAVRVSKLYSLIVLFAVLLAPAVKTQLDAEIDFRIGTTVPADTQAGPVVDGADNECHGLRVASPAVTGAAGSARTARSASTSSPSPETA
jgi:hypothetical protein